MLRIIIALIIAIFLMPERSSPSGMGLDLGLDLGAGSGAAGPSGDALLLETGDYLLLETGDYLLLE